MNRIEMRNLTAVQVHVLARTRQKEADAIQRLAAVLQREADGLRKEIKRRKREAKHAVD